MISICIPVYNQEVSCLVHALQQQSLALKAEIEVWVIDDASHERIKTSNRILHDLPLVRYIELPENIGRSRIRNLLASKAEFPWLLFLDCDVEIPDNDFLDNYLKSLHKADVVCGGHVYQSVPPVNPYYLHWLTGSKREQKSARLRSKRPYSSFMTSNFLIKRTLIQKIAFDEQLTSYGHEDTLFGYRLKKQQSGIWHIDNPVIHKGLVSSADFLEKTGQAMKNLYLAWEITGFDPDFAHANKALGWYVKIKKTGMHVVMKRLLSMAQKYILNKLLSAKPRLLVLDLYKLGRLLEIASKSDEIRKEDC